MSKANITHSVSQRLLAVSRQKEVDYNIVLIWFGLERFLYRLSKSEYADKFILKGAMLFAVWAKQPLRPTKDLDLMAYGDTEARHIKKIFSRICMTKVEDDGLIFDAESIAITAIREEQEYQGQRIKLSASLGNAKIRLQIDIGFGDVITPAPARIKYPSLLDFAAPPVRAYPKETVVAEKFHTMVVLGIANSRMKDFYDIWIMSRQFEFEGSQLAKAIAATFKRRKAALPAQLPSTITKDLSNDDTAKQRWTAFVNKSAIADKQLKLNKIISDIRNFLNPPLKHSQFHQPFDKKWSNGRWK